MHSAITRHLRFPLFIACLELALSVLARARAQVPDNRSPAVVYTLDARALNQLDLREPTNAARVWDTMHLLAALQGLANREKPQLYLFYCYEFGVDTDQFWFDWFRGEDGWLKDTEMRPLNNLREAVEKFKASYKGVAVYDGTVPATSSLASTAAGCEDLLPVRYDTHPDSVFNLLTQDLRLPVKLWLIHPDGSPKFTGRGTIPGSNETSSGSAKIDAYRWAVDRFLRAGRCTPGFAAYYLDAYWLQHPAGNPTMHTLSNHDYFIAHRAFFFDLSPWGDEMPGDDPGQKLGADKQEFLQVLRALYDVNHAGILKVGGFTPWPYKYTTDSKPPGKHEGVPTEWEFGRLISQFNGYMEADAAGLGAMANASFYQHYPLPTQMRPPNPKPSPASWKTRGFLNGQGDVAHKLFIGHYVGDYDAPSWLYKAVPAFFPKASRGVVPLGWAFDPNLADRAPQVFAYAYRHATTNDFFITGDSGAGYLNPRALTIRPDSGLPSGLKAWTEHCQKYYRRLNMTITGFVLDGAGGESTDLEFAAYKTFGPDGAGTHFEPHPAVHAGLATCREQDLPEDLDKAVEVVRRYVRQRGNAPGFLWARSILRSPDWYASLSKRLEKTFPKGEVVVVDPNTFFGLIKIQHAQAKGSMP